MVEVMHMPVFCVGDIEIPFEVRTLEGFREWMARNPDRPGRASFIQGDVYLEVNQSYKSHEPVGTKINAVLTMLAMQLDIGRYFTPPSWITWQPAGLSTEPDGFFARWDTLTSGRLMLAAGRENEMVGVPDFVLEIVSGTTVRKDRVTLPSAYAQAGIGEYWLVDARREDRSPDFQMFVLQQGEYSEVPEDPDGWRRSPTWSRDFRLRRLVDRAGLPDFRLDQRP